MVPARCFSNLYDKKIERKNFDTPFVQTEDFRKHKLLATSRYLSYFSTIFFENIENKNFRESSCHARMKEKLTLYIFIMQLAYLQLWSSYIYLVPHYTYNQLQQKPYLIWKPLCNSTSFLTDMNAILWCFYFWEMMLHTPHLTLIMLRTIVHTSKDHWEKTLWHTSLHWSWIVFHYLHYLEQAVTHLTLSGVCLPNSEVINDRKP